MILCRYDGLQIGLMRQFAPFRCHMLDESSDNSVPSYLTAIDGQKTNCNDEAVVELQLQVE